MAELMIDARDVTRNFTISRGMFRGKQQLKAVNGVDLTVERGEVLALVGESGCGKTTLAKMLLGLLPQTSGTVELCGQPINDVPRLELARTIQPIFQDPYSSLNPRKTIGRDQNLSDLDGRTTLPCSSRWRKMASFLRQNHKVSGLWRRKCDSGGKNRPFSATLKNR